MSGQAAAGGQPLARAPSGSRRPNCRASGGAVTVEELLGASGVQHADAVIFASLASACYSSLGPCLAACANLRELDLSGNELEDVVPLAALPCLSKLNLQGNPLARWPSAPSAFAALEVLDCSYCRLNPAAVLALAALPNLKTLDISSNGLKALLPLHLMGGSQPAFPALQRLSAGHNELSGAALAALAPLPALNHLLLPANRVASIPALDASAAFLQLEVLDLSQNRVADVAAVERLQSLPCLERLLLVGNPVAGAGFGASGTMAAVLHRTHAGPRRGSLAMAAAGKPGKPGAAGVAAGVRPRPGLANVFQFTAIEEASVVALKAKALGQQRRASMAAAGAGNAAQAAASAGDAAPDVSVPAASSAEPGPPGAAASSEPAACEAVTVPEAPHAMTDDPQAQQASAAAEGSLPLPSLSLPLSAVAPQEQQEQQGPLQMPPPQQAASQSMPSSFVDWDMADEDELAMEESEGHPSHAGARAQRWSVQSAAGTGTSEASSTAEYESFPWVEDPTVRMALGLGLDPLKLPLLGGAGISVGNPEAAIKALRFALAHPAAAPSRDTALSVGSGNHLRLTKSMLAKQRHKAGTDAAQGGSGGGNVKGRVATIDALLVAMQRRLAAVRAAMEAQQAEERGSGPGQATGDAGQRDPAEGHGDPDGGDGVAPVTAGSAFRQERERRASSVYMRQAAEAALPQLAA